MLLCFTGLAVPELILGNVEFECKSFICELNIIGALKVPKPFVFFQKISSTPQLPTYSLLQSLGPH